ncbi:MAG: hypothetical protein ACLTDR_16140 [Adlercreutzia equolifaciens]
MEGFALRDAGDEARAPLALRPVHLRPRRFRGHAARLCADHGGFCRGPSVRGSRRRVSVRAVSRRRYLVCRGAPARFCSARAKCSRAPGSPPLRRWPIYSARWASWGFCSPLRCCRRQPWARGFLAGAALPLLVAEWARAVAVPIDQALVLCAFVVLTASFVGWILALLPLLALVPVFCLLLVAGVVVPPVAARVGDPALPLARPADTMRRLVSVT